MNVFEIAARTKLRFSTSKGLLTTEQLWDLPLTSTKGLSLNEIGTDVQRSLREMGEESLINTGTDPEKTKAALRLDVIKHIIAVKQEENAKARDEVARKAEKAKLLEVLEKRQTSNLENLSEDAIKKRLEELGV